MAQALIGLIILAAIGYYLYEQAGTGGTVDYTSQPANIIDPVSIATFAGNAGFDGQDLQTAVQVALAESGGNANAYNPETAAGAAEGEGSVGLWQIYLTAHPEYTGDQLLDPQTNANAAYAVYVAAGYTFSPWTTFDNGNGTYNEYASVAANAVQQYVG